MFSFFKTARHNYSSSLWFVLFLCFSAGIVTSRLFLHSRLPFYIFCLTGLLLAAYLFSKRSLIPWDASFLILFFIVGVVWGEAGSQNYLDEFCGKESIFKIRVISPPQAKKTRNVFTGEIQSVEGLPLSRRIKVMDYSRSLEHFRSYEVKGKLSLHSFRGSDFMIFWIPRDSPVKQLTLSIKDKILIPVTTYIREVFRRFLTSSGYNFLSSVFLGYRDLMGEQKDIFIDAGVAHLLAISGLHVGLISLALIFILRFLGMSFRISLVVSELILFFYMFAAGAAPSVTRAFIMYTVLTAGFLLRRKVNVFNSLGIAGLIILLFNPGSLFEISFQLSFISVFAIILSFKIFSFESFKNPLVSYLFKIIFCSFSAGLFLAPLISYYFARVYVLSFLYNLLLIPIFTFILCLNCVFLALSFITPLAEYLGEALSLSIAVFLSIVEALSRFPFTFVRLRLPAVFVWGYYSLLVIFFVFIKKYRYSMPPVIKRAIKRFFPGKLRRWLSKA